MAQEAGLLVLLLEVLGELLLPLPWEIVTTDVPLGGNGGAGESSRGGGWEIENARCRKHGDLVNEGVRRWYMCGGSTDP